MAPKRSGKTSGKNAKKWVQKDDSPNKMQDDAALLDAPKRAIRAFGLQSQYDEKLSALSASRSTDASLSPAKDASCSTPSAECVEKPVEEPSESSLAKDTPSTQAQDKPIEQPADFSLATDTPSTPVEEDAATGSNGAVNGEATPDADCIDKSIEQPADSSLVTDTPSTPMQEATSTGSSGGVNEETTAAGCTDKSDEQPADSSPATEDKTPSTPVQEEVSTKSNGAVNGETNPAAECIGELVSEVRPDAPKVVDDSVAAPTPITEPITISGAVCGRGCVGQFWQRMKAKRAARKSARQASCQ